MTRIFKSVISTLVILSLVAVLPAEETTVKADQVEFATENDSNNAVFASAEIKKKKEIDRVKRNKNKKIVRPRIYISESSDDELEAE